MTALSEALVAAQRRAITAIGKSYVREPFDAAIVKDALNRIGLNDPGEQEELIEAWALVNAYGGQAPDEAKPQPHQSGPEPATGAQIALIQRLAKEKHIALSDNPELWTKQQAHEWIDQAKQR